LRESTVAQPIEDLPILADGASPVELLSLRHGLAVRLAEFAVLLVRAQAIILLLSPLFLAAALLLG
jgi:hypothetical protein